MSIEGSNVWLDAEWADAGRYCWLCRREFKQTIDRDKAIPDTFMKPELGCLAWIR